MYDASGNCVAISYRLIKAASPLLLRMQVEIALQFLAGIKNRLCY